MISIKKIVWIFGESATGKLTLVNNLLLGNTDAINTFDMSNKKIMASDITLEDKNHDKYNNIVDSNNFDDTMLEENGPYFNQANGLLRRKGIFHDIDEFINSDADILLVKGQANDLNYKRGNIIGNFLNKYANMSDLDISVYILQVPDINELKRRIENKPWFKGLTSLEEKERLLNLIPINQEEHKKSVISAFMEYNIPITIIDSLADGYRVANVMTEESNNTWQY